MTMRRRRSRRRSRNSAIGSDDSKAQFLRDRDAARAPYEGSTALSDTVLVLNAGSSSIKFALFPADQQPARHDLVCEGAYTGLGHQVHFTAKDGAGNRLIDEQLPETTTHEDVVAALLGWLEARFPDRELVAAGHRVVH